jgi:hypothetical protein
MQEEYGDYPHLERVLKLSHISNELYVKKIVKQFFKKNKNSGRAKFFG